MVREDIGWHENRGDVCRPVGTGKSLGCGKKVKMQNVQKARKVEPSDIQPLEVSDIS